MRPCRRWASSIRRLSLVWNMFGVVVGMVHYMLPYAILPLYATMRDIDRRCIMAARGLGASRGQAFRQVFLPMSVPGIVASGALVFVYSLGFFIIPAILGGGKTLMVAEYVRLQIVELINWGTGTALSVVLVGRRADGARRRCAPGWGTADFRRREL